MVVRRWCRHRDRRPTARSVGEVSGDRTSSTWQRVPLYLGGFMGPFGTLVILPMFPELRASFDASSTAVGWGFTIYLLPFALALLVSGTLGERWGRKRTVRVTYIVFAAASLLCAIAPSLEVFLAGRAVQGVANAFITPLLLAGLAEAVPPERFGRSVGIYSSFQAIGGGLAPLLGGVAADVDWRWAFVGAAVVAGGLSLAPPQGEPRRDAAPPSIRPLLTRPMLSLGAAAFFAAAGPIGNGVLIGVVARDDLDLSGSQAGLVLLAGPTVAMATGPLWGRLLDRWGASIAGFVSIVVVTALGAALALGTTPLRLTVIAAAVGGVTGFAVVVLQGLASTIIPGNRGGALSFVLAFRFLGHAAYPLLWLPVVARNVTVAFVAAASLGLATLVFFAQGLGTEGGSSKRPARRASVLSRQRLQG